MIDVVEREDIMNDDRSLHAYPDFGEADPAGTYFFSGNSPHLFLEPALLPAPELISYLRERGMELDSRDEALARAFIDEHGYFRLRGFWKAFEREGRFVPGTKFQDVADAVAFNDALSNFIMQAISCVELSLRAELSRQLASKFGPFAFNNPEVFTSSQYYRSLQAVLKREFGHAVSYKSPVVENGITSYDQLPVWAIVELTTLGTVSKIYRNLADSELSSRISKRYRLRPDYLANWLHCLSIMRNMCAHQNRLYNRRVIFNLRLFKEHSSLDKNSSFAALVVLFRMLDTVNIAKANAFRTSLAGLVQGFPRVDLARFGFPDNWREVLAVATPSQKDSEKPRSRGRNGGRPKVSADALAEALRLYDSKQCSIREIVEQTGISQGTLYKYIRERKASVSSVEYAIVRI